MGCSSEHWTRENRGVHLLRQQLAFRAISTRWPAILQQAQAQRRRTRLQTAMRAKMRFRRRVNSTKWKVHEFKKQAKALRKELLALTDRYSEDTTSVTPEEWDEVTRGKEGKVRYLLGKVFPREKWPEAVKYPNVIALRRWKDENREKRREEKDKKRERKEKRRNQRVNKETMASLPQPQPQPDVQDMNFLEPIRAMTSNPAQYEAQMAMRDAEINALKRYLAQRGKASDLLQRARVDPWSVTLEEWEDATNGTDVLEQSEEVAQLVELARRRKAEEIGRQPDCNDGMLADRPKQKE